MTDAERYAGTTPFDEIYDLFFTTVTDDMFLEWMKDETYDQIKNILIRALSNFQFPRFRIFDYDFNGSTFNFIMDVEEKNILVNLMIIEWFSMQLSDIELVRQKYSSRDFVLTSQANHMSKLQELKLGYELDSKKKQRLYKRRYIDSEGNVKTNYKSLGGGVL